MDAHGRVLRFLASLALAMAFVAGGCQSSHRYQGQSGLVASWQGRTLAVSLPDAVRVPGAHFAAAQALLGRGYAIDADEATADRGLLVARAPDQSVLGGWRKVVVRSSLTPTDVGLRITLEPVGDEVMARAILDDVLARLDL